MAQAHKPAPGVPSPSSQAFGFERASLPFLKPFYCNIILFFEMSAAKSPPNQMIKLKEAKTSQPTLRLVKTVLQKHLKKKPDYEELRSRIKNGGSCNQITSLR
jgi:hypothetical protein